MAELSFSALQARVQDRLIRDSYVEHGKSAFVLAHGGASRWLYVFRANRDQADAGDVFEGGQFDLGDGILAQRCPVTATNMAMLRNALPWLRPVPLGTLTSAGMGDRLGLATPGHVDALKRAIAAHPGKILAPIFAQQSIREMVRTN